MYITQKIIDSNPILDKNVENALVKEWQETKDLDKRNKILLCNLRYIEKFARRMSFKYKMPKEDIFSESVIGFLRGLDTFDENKSSSIRTYCTFWMQSKVQNYLYKNKSIVSFSQRNGYPLKEDVSVNHLSNADKFLFELNNLMAIAANQENSSPEESQLDKLIAKEFLQRIEIIKSEFRKTLPNEKNKIVFDKFIDCEEEDVPTYETLAQELKVTRERIRQIKNKVVDKFVSFLKEHENIVKE